MLYEITQMAYFMRGGITYDDLMFKTPIEREIIADVIKEGLEFEMKSKISRF